MKIFLLLSFFASSAMAMRLESPSFKNGGKLAEKYVYSGFGCHGKNVSPGLSWSQAPAGTKSYAVTVYDPDAPTGSGWWHWVVFNIPAEVHALPEGAGQSDGQKLPVGAVQSKTDFGSVGYGGACPPVGDKPHHYVFTVYALKTDSLKLTPDSSGALVGYLLNQNTIEKVTLTATYGRNQ